MGRGWETGSIKPVKRNIGSIFKTVYGNGSFMEPKKTFLSQKSSFYSSDVSGLIQDRFKNRTGSINRFQKRTVILILCNSLIFRKIVAL
ncbi:hypothetical protein BpHYR1_010668, partial [Brachionus plicatilis]